MTTAIEKVSRSVTIAQLAIQGMRPNDIANELGINKRSVYRDLETNEAKEILDTAQKVCLVEAVSIAEELNDLCHDDDKTLKLNAIKHHQKVTSVAPTAINNVYIDKLVQDNRQQVISADVVKALSGNNETYINAEVE